MVYRTTVIVDARVSFNRLDSTIFVHLEFMRASTIQTVAALKLEGRGGIPEITTGVPTGADAPAEYCACSPSRRRCSAWRWRSGHEELPSPTLQSSRRAVEYICARPGRSLPIQA